MEMISVLVPEVTPGHNVIVPCVTEHLNVTHRPAWYKGRSAAALPVGRGRYLWRWGGALLIQHFSSSDSGFYVCRVTVSVFGALYTVTRFSRVHTTDASPHIVSPTNSSVFKSHLGSSLVMRCTVAMGSQSASSIQVTWLVGSQSVERSSLAPRAFQKESVTGGHVEADLVILEVREEDSWAELRCVSQTSTGRQEVFVQIEMAGRVSEGCGSRTSGMSLLSPWLATALLICVSTATYIPQDGVCVDYGEEFNRVFRRPGEVAVLNCAVEELNVSHPYELTWYDLHTGRQLSAQPGRTILRGSTLWLFNLTQHHDGKYMCVVRSAGGCSKKVYVLVVEAGQGVWPERGCVNRDRSIQYLRALSTGILSCPIQDYLPYVDPSYTVTWYKGGCMEVPLGQKYLLRGDGYLQLNSVGLDEVDNYTCLFTFTMDTHTHTPTHGYMTETIETTVSVKVTYQPRILLPQGEIVKVYLGSSLHYVCRVLVPGVGADHDVLVRWRDSDTLISTDPNQRVHQILHRAERDENGVIMKSELVLTEVREEDLDLNFTCITTSGYLNPQASIKLQLDSNLLLPLGLVFGGVALLFIQGVVIYRLFRIEITLIFRDMMPYLYPSTEGDGKLYDAYVVYPRVIGQSASAQETFALSTLPKMLEGCYGYRLFILGRDCIPGEALVDVVCASLSLSRRVLLMYGGRGLSAGGVSDWGACLEQQLALQRSLLEDEDLGVVLIDLGGVPDSALPPAVRLLKEEQGALSPTPQATPTCCRTQPIGQEEEEELASINPSPRFWRELRYHMPIRGKARAHRRSHTDTHTHTHTHAHTLSLTHTHTGPVSTQT
ncbi:hypothetical protein ACEWY4_027427 [Coilia grayii]|uniref:Uncharacterized protein n=1 Tax=Coilia grayii TaxID=363190 RepID=A0ABD1ITU5_9TELE